MGIRAERKQRTRKAILDAALRLFADQGILATTTLDVARQAGVSHGALFLHFTDRDGLVAAAIELFGERVAGRLRDLVHRKAGVAEILAAHMDGIQEEEAFYARLVVEGPLLPAEARNTLTGIQSVVSIHLGEALRIESEQGKAKRLDPALVFNTWIGLLHHYLANRDLFAPGASVLSRRGGEVLNHFTALVAS
jgi:AcrR family transcriptional regulator